MRYIDGIVTRLGMQGQNHRGHACKARLSPWLWLATRRSDFRIFQNQTVADIVEQVLASMAIRCERNARAAIAAGTAALNSTKAIATLSRDGCSTKASTSSSSMPRTAHCPGMNLFLSILLKRPAQAIRKTSTPGSWSSKSSRAAIAATAPKLHGQAWPGRTSKPHGTDAVQALRSLAWACRPGISFKSG